jgi:teichuronic acid biosynthesis glycosyltransferase TuaC
MNLLFFSNLFPDSVQTQRGLDNGTVLGFLPPEVRIRALVPRPSLQWWKRGNWKPAPLVERFQPVYFPVPYLPKIGGMANHLLMAGALRSQLRRLDFKPSVVLASWLFPDGAAVSKAVNSPFVMIAQGTDVHGYLRSGLRTKAIVEAGGKAKAIITRSGDLGGLLEEAGVSRAKLHTVYNGVDSQLFRPGDRQAARAELGLPLEGRMLLFVGNFLPVKDPLLLVEAFRELLKNRPAPFTLVMLGDGPLLSAAREATADLQGRVVLPGRQPPVSVAKYLQAADILCMSSRNEGLPNVVLEALASGVPVVATDVGGIHEVISHPGLGRMVKGREPAAFCREIIHLLDAGWDTAGIRQAGEGYSWQSTARSYMEILSQAAESQ